MKTTTAIAIISLALCCASGKAVADTFGTGANQFTIEFVAIGNPGNPPDTGDNPNPAAGAVGYVYNMGKFEVSRDMVAKASTEGNLGIAMSSMVFVTGGSRPAMPATGVSWNEAARFVNWLNTSQGFSPAYKFSTQPGDVGYDANADILLWQAGDPGFNAANPFRNNLAHYFLPSVHEWHKAAYYDPSTGTYFDYPTGSNSAPAAVASGTARGTAVYEQTSAGQGPADITQAGGLSPYATMGQGGNVWEWEETELDLVNDDGSSVRGVRGGFFVAEAPALLSTERSSGLGDILGGGGSLGGAHEGNNVGFRVASVPEPSTLALFAGGLLLAGLVACQRRRCSKL
jgi:hypothetical protein